MEFSQITKMTEKFVVDNSPTILTGLGVAGVVATAFLTGKAALRADQILEEEALAKAMQNGVSLARDETPNFRELLDAKETVNLVWKEFIPPVLMGAATIAAIIGANQIGTRRTAALAAAYTLSEKASNEFKEKVRERLGEKKAQELRDEVAQERVDNNPAREIILTGNGEVKCLELFTGRYFMCSVEALKKAQNDLNYRVNNDMYASLSDFYDLLDLPHTSESDEVGWKSERLMELEFATAMDASGNPVITFDYRVVPIRDYFRLG